MKQDVNYENFLNLESLIKDSQRNTEALLELYFRLTNGNDSAEETDDSRQSPLSPEEIINTLRSVQANLSAMEISIVIELYNLKQS